MAICVEVMLDERGYGKLCDMGSGCSDRLVFIHWVLDGFAVLTFVL